jgi:Flp pilus assembly pilin Flp
MNTQGLTRPATFLQRLRRDEQGANMVEYIILVGVVALIGLAVFRAFGNQVSTTLQKQTDTVGTINTDAVPTNE